MIENNGELKQMALIPGGQTLQDEKYTIKQKLKRRQYNMTDLTSVRDRENAITDAKMPAV